MNIYQILNVEKENYTKMKEKFTCDLLILKKVIIVYLKFKNVTKHSVYYLLKLANLPKVDSIFLKINSHTRI